MVVLTLAQCQGFSGYAKVKLEDKLKKQINRELSSQ